MSFPKPQFNSVEDFEAYLLSKEKEKRGSTYGAFLVLYELSVIRGKDVKPSAQAAWKLAEKFYGVKITVPERIVAVNQYSVTRFRKDMSSEDIAATLRFDIFGKAAMRASISGRYPQ